MKQAINWRQGTVAGGAVDFFPEGEGAFTLRGGREEISLTLPHPPALSADMTLVIDVYNPQPTNEPLFARFFDADGRRMEMNVALFPRVTARAAFALHRLDGQLLFPPLTPGTLKGHVIGAGMPVKSVVRLQLGMGRGYLDTRSLEIRACFLTDDPVDFPAPAGKTVDPLGQWIQTEWPGKMQDAEQLRARLTAEADAGPSAFPEGFDRYGGWTDTKYDATGFFRTEKDGGRWRLIDPDGHAFFSAGVFGVYPGEPGWIRGVEGQFEALPGPTGEYAPAYCRAGDLELYRRKFSGMFPDDTPLYAPAVANLIRAFGGGWYDRWADMTAARLRRWGVNTLSMFSDPAFIRRAGLPYVIMLHGYPVTQQTIFREFPDVFAPEYEALCERFAAQLAAYRDDPLLIGYFLNNEPTWGFINDLNLAEKMLETGAHTHSLDALIRFLHEKYGDAAALNAAWGTRFEAFDDLRAPLPDLLRRFPAAAGDLTAFSAQMLDRYAALPSRYARAAAPNHLNLGMRFAHAENKSLLATSRHFDVFSFNCYQASPAPVMEMLAETIDKPMLVGEFHFGALDAGLPSPSLFRVASQQARGEAYARYVQSAALHPNAVGSHYFAYNDQPLWGRYDGENYQFGLVDICHTPYGPFVDRVAETNRTLRDVIEGRVPPLGGETVRL